MEETFDGLRKYTEEEMIEMLSKSLIVLDTNVLLDLYRTSPKTSDNLFKALSKYKKQLWIPHYVGIEFYKNKYNIIQETLNKLEEVKKETSSQYDKIIQNISTKCDDYKGISSFDDSFKKIKEGKSILTDFDDFINQLENQHNESVEKKDIKIEELIGNNITPQIEKEEFKNLLIEGEKRIELEIPPGYKDKNKHEYIFGYKVNGDYIIFATMIQLSLDKNKDIIFVTGDNKIDWYDQKDKRIRYELQKEFFIKTKHRIVLLTYSDFIALHNKTTKTKNSRISAESITELDKLTTFKNVREILDLNIKENTEHSTDYHKMIFQNCFDLLNEYMNDGNEQTKKELMENVKKLKHYQNHQKLLLERSKKIADLDKLRLLINNSEGLSNIIRFEEANEDE